MEKQNRKLFSTILLLVGVLCIVVSGGIFVSRTWQYIPEEVKKLCLVAVTVAFYGGSFYLEKRGALMRTPMALYHLGVYFTGFTALALLPTDWMTFAGKLHLAMLVMSVPVIWRFLRKKELPDLIMQICLTDGMLLCIMQYTGLSQNKALAICLAVVTLTLGGFVFYCKRELEEETGLLRTGLIAYVIHAAFTVPYLFLGVFCFREFLFGVLPALLITGSLTALYLAFESKAMRICQSMALLFCGLALSSYAVRRLPFGMVRFETPVVFFLAFLIGLVLMLALGRKELLCANGGLTLFYTLIQMMENNGGMPRMERPGCFPYGIVMAVAVVFWHYFRTTQSNDDRAFLKVAFAYFLLGLHAQAGWFWADYAEHYGMVFWLALTLLLLGFGWERRVGKKSVCGALCKSFSLFFAITALLANKIMPVVLYAKDGTTVLADFGVEYDCIFAGVGIVLLGIIWYSIYQEIRLVQFVGACILLGVLLLHDLAAPALPNVLFLGIVTFVVLVVATVLKEKKYAIASAITLILIVLYLTRQFWMSIAWWVYLFVAGVALVSFAIKKEKAE